MIKTFMLAEAFQKLVGQIYEAQGYQVTAMHMANHRGFDLRVKSKEGADILVETKVTRTSVVPRAEIARMVQMLKEACRRSSTDGGHLVIAGAIGIPFAGTEPVKVIDIKELARWAANTPNLAGQLNSIARELSPIHVNDLDVHAYLIFGDAHTGGPPVATPPVQRGKALADALRAVPPGREDSGAFEDRCIDAIKYIFEDDFSNWSKQQVSDDGISRYDLIARISSSHDFWLSIVEYFRSWYVIFEFKNYTDRITQGQIYTTEKYLFVTGMRTVAFIISPLGPDQNAVLATRGALRESGKLIVHLTVDDICKMLEMKDNNDEPNAYLFDRLDEMLMKLER